MSFFSSLASAVTPTIQKVGGFFGSLIAPKPATPTVTPPIKSTPTTPSKSILVFPSLSSPFLLPAQQPPKVPYVQPPAPAMVGTPSEPIPSPSFRPFTPEEKRQMSAEQADIGQKIKEAPLKVINAYEGLIQSAATPLAFIAGVMNKETTGLDTAIEQANRAIATLKQVKKPTKGGFDTGLFGELGEGVQQYFKSEGVGIYGDKPITAKHVAVAIAAGALPFLADPLLAVGVAGKVKAVGMIVDESREALEAARLSMGFQSGETITADILNKRYRELAHIAHPDVGGSTEAFTNLQTSKGILETALESQGGKIKPVSLPNATKRKIIKTLNTNVGDLFKVPDGTPYLGVKGLLPEVAGTKPVQPYQPYRTPAMGLSTREVPAIPTGEPEGFFSSLAKQSETAKTASTAGIPGAVPQIPGKTVTTPPSEVQPATGDILSAITIPKNLLTDTTAQNNFIDQYLQTAKENNQPMVVDTDEFKKLNNKDYNVDNHPVYSNMAYRAAFRAIDINPNPDVIFSAGGPGSGKSEFVVNPLKDANFTGIIIDGPLADYQTTADKIQYALEKGKNVEIDAILPDIQAAWQYALAREVETGRHVTLKAFLDLHTRYIDTVKRIIHDIPAVDVVLRDTRGITDRENILNLPDVTDKTTILDILNGVRYNKNKLTQQLSDYETRFWNSQKNQRTSSPTTAGGRESARGKVGETPSVRQGPSGSNVGILPEVRTDQGLTPKIITEQKQPLPAASSVSVPTNNIQSLIEAPGVAADYAAKVRKKQAMIGEAVKGEIGMAEQAKIEATTEQRNKIDDTILEGIKNSPYFRKEKGIKDAMGEGYLMTKGGGEFTNPKGEKVILPKRHVVVEKNDVQRYLNLGYSKNMEIDSLAKEAGFERGYDFLEHQLELSKLPMSADVRTNVEKQLVATNREFAVLNQDIREINEQIAGETVPARRLLLEKGKRELLQKQMTTRRITLRAVQDYYQLSGPEMRKINRRDLRTMTDNEFQTYLEKIEIKAFELQTSKAIKDELLNLMETREFKKTENLQRALKFPDISKMTDEQMTEYIGILEQFQHGDEFLSQRKLETVDHTDLKGIRTVREAKERMAKDIGVSLDELDNLKATEIDRMRFDTALADKNPFYRWLVDETNKQVLTGEAIYLDIQKHIQELVTKARKSHPRTFGEKLIPTDNLEFDWLNTPDKQALGEKMTPEMLNVVHYIQDYFAKARDYMAQNYGMTNFREDYITHIRRGWLEAWKDDGLTKAIGEAFDQSEKQKEIIDILNNKTGEVLPLEKFFQFSMKRVGHLVPSKNIAKAFLGYVKAFERKKMLDALIPKVDIYLYSRSRRMTERGLDYDPTMKEFFYEWMNSKKGRRVTLIFRPGDKIDNGLRALRMFTSLKDMGLNVFVQLFSNIGEQVTNYQMLGKKKYVVGVARQAAVTGVRMTNATTRFVNKKFGLGVTRERTYQGKKILEKYQNFIGESPWHDLVNVTKDVKDKFISGLFIGFRDANVRANKVFLLGSITPQEFSSGEISVTRLAELKRLMGRYRAIEGSESVWGKTTIGSLATQYKKWMLPILRTNIRNLRGVLNTITHGLTGPRKITKDEVWELWRLLEVVGVGVVVASMVNKDDRSVLGKLKQKAYQEFMSAAGMLSPAGFFQTTLNFVNPRTIGLIENILGSLKQISNLERYESGRHEGRLKGVVGLEKEIIPGAVRSFLSDTTSPNNQAKQALQPTYDEVQQLKAEGRMEEAQNIVDGLTDAEYLIYKEIKSDDASKQTKALKATVQPIFDQAQKLKAEGKKAASQALVDGMTDEEYKVYQSLKKSSDKITDAETALENIKKKNTEQGVLDTVVTYAKAIGTDPLTAFNRIFTGQKIRRLDNGAIIVDRMPLEASRAVKNERGSVSGMRLDHTIPLELGGSNSRDNLRLVTEAEWKSYTVVENFLGRKLRDGKMSKAKVQELITKFKEKNMTAAQILVM